MVGTAEAALSPEALESVRILAIQHNGRHKPFDSFARETLDHVTGQPRVGREDPVETVLSIIAQPDQWQSRPLLWVPFGPLREGLGMDLKAPHVSYNALVATRALMRMLPAIAQKQQRDEKLTMLEQETWDVYERFAALSALFDQRLELVPPPTEPGHPPAGGWATEVRGAAGAPPPVSSPQASWLPIFEATGYSPQQQAVFRDGWTALTAGVREDRSDAVLSSARALRERLQQANPSAYPASWRRHLEVWYNRAGLFGWARLLYVLAALGLIWGLTPGRGLTPIRVGMGALWAGFLLHGAGIAIRVVLGGRPPVSNFFETMLWLPFVGVVLGLVFERLYRVGYFGIAASILAAVTLELTNHVPLDASIAPVVAVLRSNLWLTIHVLTIVASYGALGLATVLAHIYGALYLVRRDPHPALASLDLFLYRAIQVGVVLLAGGTMLGAVWANASWGRYWGWDPKETWALITLLWFLAALHGRFAGWLKGVGVALCTIAGFFLLLMTYYGVSFYLVGLHSYAGGHAKPVPPLLIGYLIAEAAFMAVVGLAALRRRQPA